LNLRKQLRYGGPKNPPYLRRVKMPPYAYVIVEGSPVSEPEGQKIVNQDLYAKEPTPGPQGPQGEPGDITVCWPIHSVFVTDEETNPNILLGFGTWVFIKQIPSVDAWIWKRTA
jgi:hypothetical protein